MKKKELILMTQEEEKHDECPMREHCLKHEQCPMGLVHKIMTGKWKLLILWYLSYNTMRFSQLRKKLGNVTEKMLTQQLRELEHDKLIFRQVYPVVPPKVEYGLTDIGKMIIPVLEMMHKFGETYLTQIVYSEHSDA